MVEFKESSIKTAENHELRSNYIKKIVHSTQLKKRNSSPSTIPKNIIQFWHDHNNMPEDVKDCIQTWDELEKKGFKKMLFDFNEAQNFIEENFSKTHFEAFQLCHHPAMQCDYFRLCYIYKNGGFYVDTDEIYQGTSIDNLFLDNSLKVQPLCYDLKENKMVSPERFLNNKEYSSKWIFYLNNNPIIAPPFHPIIKIALERATDILHKNKSEKSEIQETTGPGNLTASLVIYSLSYNENEISFQLINNWDEISITPWPLSYRSDWRNWRRIKE